MKKLFLFFIIIFVFIQCSNDDTQTVLDNKTEIKLSSGLEVEPLAYSSITKSTFDYDNHLFSGAQIGFYVTAFQNDIDKGDLKNSSHNLYSNILLKSDGADKFTSDAPKMYYPQDGRKVSFYAYHPYEANVTDVEAIPVKVEFDQGNQDSYLRSDLLWANNEEVNRTKDLVNMKFKHRFSKIEFHFEKGTGVTSLTKLNDVSILGVKPFAVLNLKNGDLGPASGMLTAIRANGISTATESEGKLSGIEAIIVPQSKDAGIPLFRIKIGEVVFVYTTSSLVEFKSGMKYVYTIKVNMGSINVGSSIEPWELATPVSGHAEMN